MSFEGNQHAELNANEVSTLFQTVEGIPADSILSFTFAHRGRLGKDTFRLTITDLGDDNSPGTDDDKALFTKEYSTDRSAWVQYTSDGAPPITALGNAIRFAYEPVSAVDGDSIGNFLDAAAFGVSPKVNAQTFRVDENSPKGRSVTTVEATVRVRP